MAALFPRAPSGLGDAGGLDRPIELRRRRPWPVRALRLVLMGVATVALGALGIGFFVALSVI